MRISVFGLGYVGSVSAACLARLGHTVIGVDVDADKVAAIRTGKSPIIEPELPELIRSAVTQDRLSATTSAQEAVDSTDLTLVCVGTPSQENGSLDLSYVRRACMDIGGALRSVNRPHTVIVRSTMLPGSTDSVVIPALESASGKQEGQSFTVLYNPEFMREGSSVRDFFNPPKIVFGTRDSSHQSIPSGLYSGLLAPTFHTSIRCAEFLKYVDNAFHALKVVFANEIGSLARQFGIDSHEVMRLFCADTTLNISPAYLKPGFAFGGSCLPKDLRALTYAARAHDVDVPLLGSILPSNESQLRQGLQRILGYRKRHIGFFGVSFKPHTDDLRESPIVYLVEHLLGKGLSVRIYDESISPGLLKGSNRRYIEEHLPHFMSLFVHDMGELVEKSEVIVFCHKTPWADAVLKSLHAEQIVLDLTRVTDSVQACARYEGMSW